MKKEKIVLIQGKQDRLTYVVSKLVNRLLPEVGSTMKRHEVKKLMEEYPSIVVEITEKK